ncbi:MAG TPA: DUF3352 domain-containing protein [Nostocaceae cyanobacterium]|nr:DUF3352 domain-containing protein [Nostocaceae cyanobacterium]
MNRQNSLFGFIVAGAIALLLIISVAFYWFLPPKPAKIITPASRPHTAVLVSKLSPAMVTLLVNPEQLQAIGTKQQFTQIKNRLLAKSNINYQTDIKSWLGQEVTLAVTSTDIDHDPENGLQPGYLMVLATEKPEKSREFLELLFSQRALADGNLVVEKYKGIKLFSDNQETGLAGAIVADFVLLANHPQILREAINNLQAPDLNLASTKEYQKAIQELPQNAIAFTFFNLPLVAKWQGLELAALTYNSQISSLVFHPQGFLTETTFLANSEVTPLGISTPQTVGALQYIPENASLVITGTDLSNLANSNLAKLWEQGAATIYGSSEEAIARWAKPVVNLQTSWGLNLSQDVFSWLKGEYAIGLLPSEEKKNFDWVLVVEKTPELNTGVNRLDEIASAHNLNVSSLTLNENKVSAWTELTATTQNQADVSVKTKVQGVHTTLGNYEVFTSNLETIDTILTSKIRPLIEQADFQASIAAIPQPNQGYVYIDWQKSRNLLEKQQPIIRYVELLAKPLFDNLRSLTISSYGNEIETLKGGAFWRFNKF